MRTTLRVCYVLFLLATCVPATLQAAAIQFSSDVPVSGALSINYDPTTGRVMVDAPNDGMLTAFELRSASNQFTQTCENLGGVFDICSDRKVFKMDPDGYASVDFGPVLPAGLTKVQVMDDITVDGASFGGGFEVGQGIYLVHSAPIPEPSALGLLGLVLLALRRFKA